MALTHPITSPGLILPTTPPACLVTCLLYMGPQTSPNMRGLFYTKIVGWVVAPKDVSPRMYEGTLSEERVFAELVKNLRWGHPGSGWPQIQWQCPYMRQRRRDTDTERNHKKREVEMGGMRPQAQGCLEPPESGRGEKDHSLEPPEEAWLCLQLDSDVCLQDWGRMNSCCFKPPSLLSFVTKATGQPHRPCPIDSWECGSH